MSDFPERDVEVIQVVRTALTLRGATPKEQQAGEVARRIIQYWSLDGELLAEVDVWADARHQEED